MTRKKCKECKGRGFVFITVPDVKFKSIYDYSIRDTGEKAQCMKCFGKGVK
jgi:DnaJ-class molecular chaperone